VKSASRYGVAVPFSLENGSVRRTEPAKMTSKKLNTIIMVGLDREIESLFIKLFIMAKAKAPSFE
jgi:hypothetical protein